MASAAAPRGASGDKRKRDHRSCSNPCCHEDLTDRTYFELKPCGCEICPGCFGECHATRNLRFPRCPTCKSDASYHICCTSRIGRGGREATIIRESPSVYYFAIQGQCDEVDAYLSSSAKFQLGSTCFLVFSRLQGDRNFTLGPSVARAAASSSVSFGGTGGTGSAGGSSSAADDAGQLYVDGWGFVVNNNAAQSGCLGRTDKANFGTLGSVLNAFLLQADVEHRDPASLWNGKPGTLQDFAAADESALKEFIFRLSVGFEEHSTFDDKRNRNTPHNKCFVISELLRSIVSNEVVPFQRAMAKVSQISASESNKFMGRFGLMPTAANIRQSQSKDAYAKFMQGIPHEPCDVVNKSLDNWDKKKAGRKGGVGVHHHITSQLDLTTGAEIAETTRGLSFEGQDWNDVKDEVKRNGGLVPKSKHVASLHRLMAKMTTSVATEMSKLPGIDRVYQAGSRGVGEDVVLSQSSDNGFGHGQERLMPGTVVMFELADDDDGTMWGLNNAFPDTVAPENLADRKKGVIPMLNSAVRVWAQVVGDAEFDLVNPNNLDQPNMAVGRLKFAVSVDGQPYLQMVREQDRDPTKYAVLRIHAGGFHRGKKAHEKRGTKNIGLARVSHLVAGWRDSEPKRKWVLDPSNPNDADSELWEYVVAHLYVLIHAFIRKNRSKISTDGKLEMTVVELRDMAMDQAGKYPETMLGEYDILTGFIALMYQDAESAADGDMFDDANILMQIVYIMTNADYMRIAEDDAKFEHTLQLMQDLV